MSQRTLVTGAGGFVGANLCRRLLADGHAIVAIVRPGSEAWRLADLAGEVDIREVELGDVDGLDGLLASARPDWLFHLAAHGAYSWQTSTQTILHTNAVVGAALIDCAVAHGVSAFVHAGSSSEYGFKDHPPSEQEWIEPNSAYAVGKAATTLYGRSVARARDAHIVTVRLYSVYGPWEEPNRLLPTLAVHGLQRTLPALTQPETARDFVFVDDICEACIIAAAANDLERGAVFNLGSGRQTTLAELVTLARRECGIEAEPVWATMADRVWDTSSWVADPRRIAADLGWAARTPLDEGFPRLIAWLAADGERLQRYRRAILGT